MRQSGGLVLTRPIEVLALDGGMTGHTHQDLVAARVALTKPRRGTLVIRVCPEGRDAAQGVGTSGVATAGAGCDVNDPSCREVGTTINCRLALVVPRARPVRAWLQRLDRHGASS